MSLKPNESMMLAVAVSGLVFATFSLMLPHNADVRSLPGNVPDIDAAEKTATITSVGVVSGVALLAKAPEVLILGGVVTMIMAWTTKHASKVDSFQESARSLITPASDHTPSGITKASATDSQSLTLVAGGAGNNSAF